MFVESIYRKGNLVSLNYPLFKKFSFIRHIPYFYCEYVKVRTMQLLLYYHIYNLPSNLCKNQKTAKYGCLLVYLFILQIRAVFLITLCQSISIFIIKHKKCIVKFKNTPPNSMAYSQLHMSVV